MKSRNGISADMFAFCFMALVTVGALVIIDRLGVDITLEIETLIALVF